MTTQADTVRASNDDRLQAIAAEIAAALGLTIEPPKECGYQTRSQVRMVGSAGELVSLSVNVFGKANHGKIEIDGATYRVNKYGSSVGIDRALSSPTIRVSLSKSAAEVVADIKRRFWPAYMAELEAFRVACKAYEDRTNSIAARTRKLSAIIGAPIRQHNGADLSIVDLYRSRDIPETSGDFKVQGDGCLIERLYVSDAVAAEILRILAREHKAPTE